MSYKRILLTALALLLCLGFLLSLASCNAAGPKLDEIQADLLDIQQSVEEYQALSSTPTPVKSAEDFRWNGQTEVWFLLPEQVSPEHLIVSDVISAMCQTNGWTFDRKETGTAQELLKEAIAAGDVGAFVCADLTGLRDSLVQQAANEGILFLCLSAGDNAPIAGSVSDATEELAAQTIALLDSWCRQTNALPEEETALPLAVSLHGASSAKDSWPAALLDALDESNLFFPDRIGLACEEDDTIFNAAYLWARSVMAENPETRLFCCYTPEAAYGICYYLEQYAADEELDLADFCVVWNGEDEDSQTYLTVARENASYTAARGYVSSDNDAWATGTMLGYELLGIAYGTELPATPEETFTIPAQNGVAVPDHFGGWLWGERALRGVNVYASFAEKDDLLLTAVPIPMTDLIDLSVPAEEAE